MKKCFCLLLLLLFSTFCRLRAQDPITLIIKEAIVKAIRAADLQIQRLQNETIWLQNAQKTVENAMSKLKLEEISGWVERQKMLYEEYFEELRKVKTVLTYYHKVRDIVELENSLIRDYRSIWTAAQQDPHLSAEEAGYIRTVVSGILHQSVGQLEAVSLVLESFTTQMSDAARIKMIEEISQKLQRLHNDLRQFSDQNKQLSLARAKDAKEISLVRALYGR